MTRTENDVLEALRTEYDIPVSEFDGKYTKSTIFLVHMIGLYTQHYKVKKYFQNIFLNDMGYEHDIVRPLFILMSVADFEEADWKAVQDTFQANPNYITDYDCGIKDGMNLVMFVFKIPDIWKDDYYHFKAGRYSKFTEAYKKLFPSRISNEKGISVDSVAYMVIHKVEEFKKKVEKLFQTKRDSTFKFDPDNEIWGLPIKEREYYRYNPDTHGKQNKEG